MSRRNDVAGPPPLDDEHLPSPEEAGDTKTVDTRDMPQPARVLRGTGPLGDAGLGDDPKTHVAGHRSYVPSGW